MKLVVISGKGGTGKTTIASSIIVLARAPYAYDCDVDASNLGILLEKEQVFSTTFQGAQVARLDASKCTGCGACVGACRYGAVSKTDDGKVRVDPMKCEGCKACVVACPEDALALERVKTAERMEYAYDGGKLAGAELIPGAEGSGLLVTEVRKSFKEELKRGDLAILDGSPGVGCNVMASVSNTDGALIVAEPTISGYEDFKRVHELLAYMGIPSYLCVNKWDINEKYAEKIEAYAREKGMPVVGRIPFDEKVLESVNRMIPIVKLEQSIAKDAIVEMWYNLKKAIGGV